MADPTLVSGKLVNSDIEDFSAMRVEALYTATGEGGDAPASQSVQAAPDGSYSLSLPPPGQWKGPLTLNVTGGSGLFLGRVKDVAADDPGLADLDIAVAEDLAPVEVTASDDPALGALARFTGRVIDSKGNPQRAGLMIVIWGLTAGETEPHPIAMGQTTTGGYFAGEWPSEALAEANARVAGTADIPIPLDGNRLPRRIILVADDLPPPEEAEEGPADPPRAPTAEELAGQSEAFADDAGCCATFTTPNRTVEEVMFQAVVRTTQPAIRGSGVRRPRPLPGKLADRIVQLTKLEPLVLDFPSDAAGPRDAEARPEVPAEPIRAERFEHAVRRGAARMQPASGELIAAAAVMERAGGLAGVVERSRLVLEARDLRAEPLRLESSVAAELAREPGGITPARLLKAEHVSLVRHFRNQLDVIDPRPISRFEQGPGRQLDWDSAPLAYQATTIAHGHLLTMKQVWRADGYSLGDVLYSLPLAPGQQKLVSILDWERRDEARRTEHRIATESVSATLSHDRDISDIVRSALHERMDASSRATTSAVSAGIGGFIGPVVFGASGGVSKASSSAQQASARDIAATALNQARDRTLQASSAVRGQRATVVQTARQGESVRAQTEAIVNNNHCHAMTIEYFEVLRHFQVSQEIAHVQECLFIPFAVTPFNDAKALRWKHLLQDMSIYHGGTVVALRPHFEALERVVDNWVKADYPAGRYADEALRDLSGEVWITLNIPRPADLADHAYNQAEWKPYQELLGVTTDPALDDIWKRYMGVALPEHRAGIWNTRLAPAVARRLIDKIIVQLERDTVGVIANVNLDATLVSAFAQNLQLLVSFRAIGAMPGATRAEVDRVRLAFSGIAVPPQIQATVHSGTMRYRTDHMTRTLFGDYRIQNDLTATDPVEIATPLDREEKRNPRLTDKKMARLLIDILNERLEYFHRLLWLAMDPNRRYMFLDGIVAPDADGRSVASVVENRVIGIVGNSLVMPVVPGLRLDPTYEFAARTQEDLKNLYATDPPPPMRISVPTRGVFAEAIMGKCNSCEKIDDTLFWRWEQAPIPDSPTAIAPLSTRSLRRAPPSVLPSDFPTAIVRMQETPQAPDPTGLNAALALLGTKDLFRNLTGVALNQENAQSALKGVMSAAQSFASQGAALAQQRFLSGQVDRNLDLIKKAVKDKTLTEKQGQAMTEGLFKGALGTRKAEPAPVATNDAVNQVTDKAMSSKSGEVRFTGPGGSVEVKVENKAPGPVDVKVDPPVGLVQQTSAKACWAAVGTMMKAWKAAASMTINAVIDPLGEPWKGKLAAGEALTGAEFKAFADKLGLKEEGPMSQTVAGLAALLKSKGPLLTIGDNDFDSDNLVHARILVAIKGDGTPDGTQVTVMDPSKDKPVPETFTKFAQRIEAAEAVKAGRGLFHW